MTREADGYWTYVSPEPEAVGFHYYQLVIDSVYVADPATKSYYGMSRWVSAIEIPEGLPYDKTQNVPHGDIRMKKYWSEMTQSWRMCYVYTPPCMIRRTTNVTRFYICSMVGVRMKQAGYFRDGWETSWTT